MPYKSEKIRLPESCDRRIKLTKEQKFEICLLRSTTDISQRKLAEIFGVSRRTIQFTINPEKLIENKLRREERGGWEQYYDPEKHREYMKDHRRYKHQLFKKGLLT